MKKLVGFVLVLCVVSAGHCVEKKVKKVPETPRAAEELSSAPVWVPIPFSGEFVNLGARFEGNDLAKFFSLFRQKVSGIKKGEYETTAEFEARVKSAAESLVPFDFSASYAFAATGISISYDADKQYYRARWNGVASCSVDTSWMFCPLGMVGQERETYIGSNAYGAKASIEKVTATYGAFAVPPKSSLGGYFRPSGVATVEFSDNVYVPLEKARQNAGKSVRALFIGKIAEPRIVEKIEAGVRPTVQQPIDLTIITHGIPMRAESIIYYVYETGEVLKVISLNFAGGK